MDTLCAVLVDRIRNAIVYFQDHMVVLKKYSCVLDAK